MVGSTNYDDTRMKFDNYKLDYDPAAGNTILDYQVAIDPLKIADRTLVYGEAGNYSLTGFEMTLTRNVAKYESLIRLLKLLLGMHYSFQIFVHLLLAKWTLCRGVLGKLPYSSRGHSWSHGSSRHALPCADQHFQHHHQHFAKRRGHDGHFILDDCLHVLCFRGAHGLRLHPLLPAGKKK